jgi:hypothetical protein
MAYNYMQQYGTSDAIYVAYFGADSSGDHAMKSDVFDVCLWLS